MKGLKLKIFVGSHAAKFHLKNWHKVNDIDIWTDGEVTNEKGKDICKMPTEILSCFQNTAIATLDDLYTIKISHLPYDIFFNKHKSHALVFKKHGAKLNQKLYKLLQEYWKQEHGNKDFLNLYRTKTEFFDDAVEKKYDHDWMHEMIAYPNRPVYTTVLRDGQEVLVDKAKFDRLEFAEQVKMFREEMCVIACERWLLNPAIKKAMPVSKAWAMSLRKTATALTKGWASRFICENLEYFVKPDFNEFRHLFNYVGKEI